MISVFQKQHVIDVAMGRKKAELVISGGKIVNVFTGEIYSADIAVSQGIICGIGKYRGEKTISIKGAYVCPGLIDAHVHIESSRATPREVIRHALAHGNTAFIAEPHDIANVFGTPGIGYMLFETENVPFGAYFAAPACAPAEKWDDGGAVIDVADLQKLACLPRMVALGEMMDVQAILSGGKDELEKIETFGYKPSDGHLMKSDYKSANAYFAAGIMSNHGCESAQDAVDQLRLGAYVGVQQGSFRKNAAEILRGIKEADVSTRRVLLCSGEKYIEDIAERGLTIELLRLAVSSGIDPVEAVQMATINTADAYGLRHAGAVAPGRYADIVCFSNLENFAVEKVFYHGELVSEKGSLPEVMPLNCDEFLKRSMAMRYVTESEIGLKVGKTARVINIAKNGRDAFQTIEEVPRDDGFFLPTKKYAKLCAIERRRTSGEIGMGIVSGFGISGGCIAATVSHDSHNVIAATDNDADLLIAIDALNKMGGGLVVVSNEMITARMPLAIGGIMSDEPFETLREQSAQINEAAHKLGVPKELDAFETLCNLSNTALGGIRLTAGGIFDAQRREFVGINARKKDADVKKRKKGGAK